MRQLKAARCATNIADLAATGGFCKRGLKEEFQTCLALGSLQSITIYASQCGNSVVKSCRPALQMPKPLKTTPARRPTSQDAFPTVVLVSQAHEHVSSFM